MFYPRKKLAILTILCSLSTSILERSIANSSTEEPNSATLLEVLLLFRDAWALLVLFLALLGDIRRGLLASPYLHVVPFARAHRASNPSPPAHSAAPMFYRGFGYELSLSLSKALESESDSTCPLCRANVQQRVRI